MKGQMAHDTLGVAGGAGLAGGLIFFAWVFLISLLFGLVKIAVFAFCAITLAKAIKNPKEFLSIKKVALFLLCIPLGIFLGYLLLIDLNPFFLNVFANEDPSICELHASPIFTLNILRFDDTVLMGYYGTAYYDDCMRQNPRFGKDLEFCNEIKKEMHSGGGGWATMDCIKAATAAGATNCEAINNSYYQRLCLEGVGMENVSAEDCWEIDKEDYRGRCLYDVATRMEDCESIPGYWGEACIGKLASTREDCMRIDTPGPEYQCYTNPNLASTVEDCEQISDEFYMDLCIRDVATSLEDCDRMPNKNDFYAECICKLATKIEDCERIEEHWRWNDCVERFETGRPNPYCR